MFERLFEPVQIAKRTVKNRIFVPGHGTQLAKNGQVSDELVAYHTKHAAGGAGLIVLDPASVDPSSTNQMICSWADDVLPGYERLSAALHSRDCLVFQQLWHGGAHFAGVGGAQPWSSTAIVSPFSNRLSHAMTRTEIDRIVAGYAAAARRAEAGGLDGVEVHAGHGYLIQQFLSPIVNSRADDYGGSFDNRARLLQEVLRAVRAEVSTSFAVGIRISDEMTDGGLTADDCADVVALLEAENLIDFVNASQGSYFAISAMLPSMAAPRGSMLPSSTRIVKRTETVRMLTGRLQTLAFGEELVQSGTTDMVGFVRAIIADPDLVVKSRAGELQTIRPCIGCNEGCVGGIFGASGRIGCAVNPSAGRELSVPDIPAAAEVARRIAVVGGGIAGMETARLAAERGHDVVLYEKHDQLGGALRYAARAPHAGEIELVADWLVAELARLRVRVVSGVSPTPEQIASDEADTVVIATGAAEASVPRLVASSGMELEMTGDAVHLSIEAVLSGQFDLGQESSVLVYDDTGGYEAIGAAEALLAAGHRVTFVTRFTSFSPRMQAVMRGGPALKRMDETGRFELRVSSRLVSVSNNMSEVCYVDGGLSRWIPTDAVCIAGFRVPNRSLGADLTAAGLKVEYVGDAVQAKNIQSAMSDAYKLAARL